MSELARKEDPVAEFGPFAAGAPGLGYHDYFAKFDADAEMWRQLVPGEGGRGLALGRFGLQEYEEYMDMPGAAMAESDPLWVPMLVEWTSLTVLDGTRLRPGDGYIEKWQRSSEYYPGWDALPMVGIASARSTFPSLVEPWSVDTPDGVYGGLVEGYANNTGEIEMIMPVQHVLPIEDDHVLKAIAETIAAVEYTFPLDNCMPTYFNDYSEYGYTKEEQYERARDSGHVDGCFHQELQRYGSDFEFLGCVWDAAKREMVPCGGAPHIEAVVSSFLEAQPYERLCFDPEAIPYWDHLKDRATRFYDSLLQVSEAHQRGRDWFYSYLQRWSPWGHSSQVPERVRV